MTAPSSLSPAAAIAYAEITVGLDAKFIAFAGHLLEVYAVAVARQRGAQSRIDTEGIIIANPKGDPIPHPALAIEKASSAEIRASLTQLRAMEQEHAIRQRQRARG